MSYGFASSYQSVKRFVRKLRGGQAPEARAVIETAPGEEAQVDYGSGPMVRDPRDRQVSAHAAVRADLGCSRKSVRLLAFRSSARIWAELHERAFAGWAAPPASSCSIICARACSSPTSTIPRSIHSIATCSRTTARSPCPVASAIRIARARSSRGVGHAQRTPLKGLRFESLEEAQTYLDRWEERWADTRIHGTTKRQVAAMFAEEKPCSAAAAGRALSLLPIRRAHGASGRLRRGRSGLLQRAARLDRARSAGAVG